MSPQEGKSLKTEGRRSAAKQRSACPPLSPLKVLLLLPVTVSGMHIVPAPTHPAAALSLMSIAGWVAWSLAGTSISLTAITAVTEVPKVVRATMHGIEDLVMEITDGSVKLVR